MCGLLILKSLEDLSDDNVVLQWKRNPYYQAFCGMTEYQAKLPCDGTELGKFRTRIGEEGAQLIFGLSVGLHGEAAEEKEVIVDTTVQEKNVTYPTDGKMAIRIISHLHKIAKREGIKLRRSYVREIRGHRLSLRFFRHPKKRTKAQAAMRRLRTIAKSLIRDIDRKFGENMVLHAAYAESFYLFMRVLLQTKSSKHKIYSLHEPHIYCMGKGKDHKPYEYGTKASIVSTKESNIILGVCAHETHTHDSKTLNGAIEAAKKHRTHPIIEAIVDRGYRGIKMVGETKVSIPGTPLKGDTPHQKNQKRRKFRRRAAIEPIIGHLKSDYRLCRNYLRGLVGDQINLLMAACAWNMARWMAAVLFLWSCVCQWVLRLMRLDNRTSMVKQNGVMLARS